MKDSLYLDKEFCKLMIKGLKLIIDVTHLLWPESHPTRSLGLKSGDSLHNMNKLFAIKDTFSFYASAIRIISDILD